MGRGVVPGVNWKSRSAWRFLARTLAASMGRAEVSPRITAPLSQGPGSRWYGDDTFYGKRKRTRADMDCEPSPFSLDGGGDSGLSAVPGDVQSRAMKSVWRGAGRGFEPAEMSSDDDDQDVRSSKSRPHVEKLNRLSPVFSPVEPDERSRELMGNISPLSIGPNDSKYAFPVERPRSTFFKRDAVAVVGVSAWASCQQTPDSRETPASQEPAHRYCMLCSLLFSEMPRTARVMRPSPEGCGHAFCKSCYDAALGVTTITPSRVSACPECTRLGDVEARVAKSTTLAAVAASSAPPDIDFDALGVAKFSAAFEAAQLAAPALIELVDSAHGSMDDVVACLHMELDIDIGSCEWISEQVAASRLHDVEQNLRRNR